MRKAKYVSECCDHCGEFVSPYQQVVVLAAGMSGAVHDAWFVHDHCEDKMEGFLAVTFAKSGIRGLSKKRIDVTESVTPKLEMVRQLRAVLCDSLIKEPKLKNQLLRRLYDMQMILSPVPTESVTKLHYDEMQLDDECNLLMLKKILSISTAPKVANLSNHLIVADPDGTPDGIATAISAQLANLINGWGLKVIDGMLNQLKKGAEPFAALERLCYTLEELGLPVDSALEAVVKTTIKLPRRV